MNDPCSRATKGGRGEKQFSAFEIYFSWYKLFQFAKNMHGINRSEIRPGMRVFIVLKEDQRTGKLTEGIVQDILTRSPAHPHGIKVRLETGQVGRVKKMAG